MRFNRLERSFDYLDFELGDSFCGLSNLGSLLPFEGVLTKKFQDFAAKKTELILVRV